MSFFPSGAAMLLAPLIVGAARSGVEVIGRDIDVPAARHPSNSPMSMWWWCTATSATPRPGGRVQLRGVAARTAGRAAPAGTPTGR